MAESWLTKVDGKWGVYDFTNGFRFSPRAFSEKRVSDDDDSLPAYSKDLTDLLLSLIYEGKLREAYEVLGEKFPEWDKPDTPPSA